MLGPRAVIPTKCEVATRWVRMFGKRRAEAGGSVLRRLGLISRRQGT